MKTYTSALNKELDIVTIKQVKRTENVNELQFDIHEKSELYSENTLFVRDLDCCKEKSFTIGETGFLGDWDENDSEVNVLIESFEQVITAWESGKVWF